ncbi:MAG TPA: hypothetical protein VFY12_01245 [Arenimonas sp.]|nr:hypothetical protein [Arenimonas sp.]
MRLQSRQRIVAAAVITCIAVLLAWRVLTLGLADHWQSSDPERALRWREDHPVALLNALDAALRQPADAKTIKALALSALQASPLNGRPYRVLAQLREAEDGIEAALPLYNAAVHRGPRDRFTHARLFDYGLQTGDVAKALGHFDFLLRLRPQTASTLLPVLVTLAAEPAVQPALAAKLSDSPPWRAQFLRLLAQTASDSGAVEPLWQLLRTGAGGGLPQAELQPWLDRLLRDGQGDRAYLVWVSQLGQRELTELGNVYNGDFELAPSGFGFDWRFGRVPGARIDRMPVTGASGNLALRVAFDDRRVPFAHVQQVLALPPGMWRLQGRARADALRSERGLVWQVNCHAGGAPLGRSEPLRGQRSWHAFALAFEVPAQGCSAQVLRLLLPARIPAERRIGGQAWYDGLAISRAPTP